MRTWGRWGSWRRVVVAVPVWGGVLLWGGGAASAWDWSGLLGHVGHGARAEPAEPRVWKPRRGPVFDWRRLASTPLQARVLGQQVKGGVVTQRVMFHSHMDGLKRVDIFAFFSFPQPRAGEKPKRLPAFVWIEGGLAKAKPFRTVFGARRGYATLAIDFPLPGYRSTGSYPINLGMFAGENPRQAPIYHGAVALLKAVSFLQSRPNVDARRVGMAGSSWGGFYTTLMAGVDPRLKAASAMYGTGSLHAGNMWWDAYGRSARFPPHVREHWRGTLDPALRIGRSKVPIAWLSGTNDWFFWMPALSRTYALAGAPKSLSLLPNWDHALTGELSEQAFAWLDVHLKGRPAFLKLSPLRVVARGGFLWAGWEFSGPASAARRARFAEVAASPGGAGNWHARAWGTLRASVRSSAGGGRYGGRCWARLPRAGGPFYLSGSVEDAEGFRYSTPPLRVDPARLLGKAWIAQASAPAETSHMTDLIDGCAPWGGFEKGGLVFLRRHKWLWPRAIHESLSADAVGGHKSLRVGGGTVRLPLLRFVAGRRHRLRFWAKALGGAPLTAGLRFNAGFLGKPRDGVRWFRVGPEWQPVEVEVEPHEDLTRRYNAALLLPPGREILCDDWSLRPLPEARAGNGLALTATS